MFEFDVVSGTHIKSILEQDPARCIRSVARAYLAHHDGQTINPDSYFLRFPQNERNRIIALPASIDGDSNVSGIKWIASFPGNVEQGLPRASAVLVLNDQATGYPFALLEGSLISSARTAASAVLGALWLNGQQRHVASISFIGAGVIARNILAMFSADGWSFERIAIHDTDDASAAAFAAYAGGRGGEAKVGVETSLARALEAHIVVFATNAGSPYVKPPARFAPGQVVLNISLRDIGPELILDAVNIFDDVDHCMKANTSPHLAEQLSGNRDFATGTIAQLLREEIQLDRAKPLIYSPFGMGMLDLALGKEIYDLAKAAGLTTPVPNFFGERSRW
ncbi:2,3-diaminopropionate biosynthesis protein SbnB [Rugamonas sp. CCM 8940]|uniref:2,3-diaminopropionate biosynthesis protein SbnB n=1 Tax=Rugamonas sp. CCM 8940 TaxID=2765359 RepID=UPI0018F6B8E2|nr:2,3-diaminopropionate biosynthesis protein SbnB [Rugamonas sp. CCM 8940]MBJ7312363.1 2,3-diaminopropionate biosynthesis protein SbnB [Rugamonas sp. CCM 8940]